MSTAAELELEVAEATSARDRDDWDLHEVLDGLHVEIPPMSAYVAKIATRLATRINFHAEAHGLGETVVESLFRLPLVARRPSPTCG